MGATYVPGRDTRHTNAANSAETAARAKLLLILDRHVQADWLVLGAGFGLCHAFIARRTWTRHALAVTALLAAQLAAGGMRSSLDVLEGEAGLGQAMSTGPDWSTVGATLGADFHITRLTFKNHIGCGHTFAAGCTNSSLLTKADGGRIGLTRALDAAGGLDHQRQEALEDVVMVATEIDHRGIVLLHLLQLVLLEIALAVHLGKLNFQDCRLNCLCGLLELGVQFHLLDGMDCPSHMD